MMSRIVGIIAEYNPFHNGHAYHLMRARKAADFLVIVMSGNFVQRGEPAIVDKRARTEMALRAGADIVLEMPTHISSASAGYFARGAVEMLAATGVVDTIAFGAEAELIHIKEVSELIRNEPLEYARKLRAGLDEGLAYPVARAKAAEIFGGLYAEVLRGPNNVLGIEYINSLNRIGSDIECLVIKRTVEHTGGTCGSFASASVVRRIMEAGGEFETYVPHTTKQLLEDYGTIHRLDNLSHLFHHRLRLLGEDGLRGIADVGEGLENRILRFAKQAYLISDIIARVKTKRYTMSRIRRIILYVLLGITELGRPVEHLRLLGMRRGSEELLRKIASKANVPLVSTPRAAIRLEARDTDIYYLSADCPTKRLWDRSQEYRLPVVI